MSLRVGCALLAGPRLRVPCLCSSIWPESQDPDVPIPARYGSVPQGTKGAIPDSAEEAAI